MLDLSFSPFPVLETERLLLREHNIDDATALFDMRRNEEVMRYIDRERPKTIEDIYAFIRKLNQGFKEGQNLAWVIALKDTPQQMIGSIGYWRTDLPNHRAEIGYMLQPDYWRKGIVSEALKATIAFGFNEAKFHSINANINPGNNASRALLLKHGFIKEAYFREDYYFNGKFMDSEIYGLLKTDVLP